MKFKTLFLSIALVQTSLMAFGQESFVSLQIDGGYKAIGQLQPKSVTEVKNELITVGCETLDRDYTDYDEYKAYLPALGIKKIRLQAGWAKTEKQKGVYDFAWLDHIIDDAVSRGLKPWLQCSYGNPIYPGGGNTNLGGGMPKSEEAKAAWNRWVEAMAKRYLGKVNEWELWNEPDLSQKISAEEIVELNIRTAEIIKKVDPNAKIAGFAFCVLNKELLEECMELVKKQDKLGLFYWISYHGYEYRPENSYKGVMSFREIIDRYAPQIRLRQGENGAPSKGHFGGALDDYDWTELSQAKWDLRRLAGDHGHDVESSVFSIIDMAYPRGENEFVSKINVKGLIESSDAKKALRPKLAYRAVQHYAAMFDVLSTRVNDFQFSVSSGNASDYAHFLYKHENISSLMIWKQTEKPQNTNVVEYKDITIDNASFENPVWVDMLTGHIFEVPAASISKSGDKITFKGVPVYDSPVVITDKSALR